MGKRKRATKPPPKKKTAKLAKVFDCPVCGHESTVDCIIKRDMRVGRVECRVCGVKYSSVVSDLDEEVDVYTKWMDACEEASRLQAQDAAAVSAPRADGAERRAKGVLDDVHDEIDDEEDEEEDL